MKTAKEMRAESMKNAKSMNDQIEDLCSSIENNILEQTNKGLFSLTDLAFSKDRFPKDVLNGCLDRLRKLGYSVSSEYQEAYQRYVLKVSW